MYDKSLTRYALESYSEELLASRVYRELAYSTNDKSIREKLLKASEMENYHAEFWRRFLLKRNIDPGKGKYSRLKLLGIKLMFKVLGIGFTLKILERGEREAIEVYSKILSREDIDDDEKNEIRKILEDELLHEEDFLEEEGRFKEFLDHIRDAVLGMSDGLVEILSVSAGLAGVYGNPYYVALGGAIVGIGGALSMGIGAYISVKSQNQVKLGSFSRMAAAAKYATKALVKRVSNELRRRGFKEETLKKISEDLERNPVLLGKLAAEEEHGYGEETIEKPLKAGIYTGLFYIIGSIFPLAPYFIALPVSMALPLSFILAGLLLAITGFIIALSASLSIREKMFEMVIAGLGAASLTYLIGHLASAILGIEVS